MNDERVGHPLFDDRDAWLAAGAVPMFLAARKQLGTVGAGNHYVDLFREVKEGVDEAASLVWIGIHFGSRGLGHRLATQYLKRGGSHEGIDVKPAFLHQDSDLGRGYLAAMKLAGRYAYAGREWVAGAPAWVVRKGCTPAFPSQRGFVGGPEVFDPFKD